MAETKTRPTRIYVVRHGETAWNRDSLFRGRADVPLNEKGRLQVDALGRRLGPVRLSAIYSSPLGRALQTAEAILRHQSGGGERPAQPPLVIVEEAFSDPDVGLLEGLDVDQAREQYPDFFRTWRDEPQRCRFPGGDSLPDALHRSAGALDRVVRAHPGEAVAIATHRVICKMLVFAALGLGLESFWRLGQQTACLNIIEGVPGALGTVLVNDTCHLREGNLAPLPTDI